MAGRECYVLDTGCDSQITDFICAALTGQDPPLPTTLAEMSEISPAAGAEMGVLFVPFVAGVDLAPISAAVARLRAAGAHLSVLGVAMQGACAAQVDLGTCFDDVTCMEWRSAPSKIAAFTEKQTEQRQRRAFRAFLDTSVDGYWIWDIQRDVLEWSQRTRDMVRVSLENSPTCMADFTAMIHPEDLGRVHLAVENHLYNGAPYRDIGFRMLNGSGEYGAFVANGQALRDHAGAPMVLVGSVTDRTLINRVEQQLEDTQRRFTMLFHRMNDAAVLADIESGLILEANEPAERLWGKPISELVGSHQTTLHPPALTEAAREAFIAHIGELMQNNRATIQVPVLRADKTEVPTEISSSLIEIGGKTMILGVFRDITERVKAERDIRERDAQLQLSSHLASMGTLAAGVAHEINNPLTYVLGNLEFLKENLAEIMPDSTEMIEAVNAAATGSHYLREIVADLKAISRMDASDEACNPAEVIRVATRMAMSDLRHRAVLELDLQDVPSAPISAARLTQVVLNIFSNAARSFPTVERKHNVIRAKVSSDAKGVTILIEDNGVGISPEDLKRVFEPFFTRNHTTGGTGLGLAISRRILTEAGGTLEITSALGRGTSVTIHLPTTSEMARAQQDVAAPEIVATLRSRVLVLDDDVLVSGLIEQVLRKDFDPVVFNDPLLALQALADGEEFDAILCDLMMPEMSGSDFYLAANALPRSLPPFLFITGGGVTQDCVDLERRMSKEGRLLFKPFIGKDLRAKVKETIKG